MTRARYIIWVLLVTFAVVAIAEGTIRVLDHRLEEPLQWYHISAQRKDAEMDRLAEAGLTSDLTFIGTSMVAADIVTERFEERLVTIVDAHNLALPAAQATVVKRWVLEAVLPKLHPDRVIWGISTLDFNSNRAELPIETYDRSRATRHGVLGVMDRVLDHLALSHHREKLRDLSVLEDLGVSDRERSLTALEDALLGTRRTDENDAKRADQLRRIETEVVNDYTTGERELDAFRTTIDTLLHAGVEVVVVFMPISLAYIDAHPRGASDVDVFHEKVTDIAISLGVEVIDMSSLMDERYFADNTHLNREGAELFSTELIMRLVELDW